MTASIPPRASSEAPGARASATQVGLVAAFRLLTSRQRIFIAVWCLLLVVPSLVLGRTLTAEQRRYAKIAHDRHVARITGAGPERTEPERTPPRGHENDVPREVRAGIYVDRISALSVVDFSWTAEFYLWFTWDGDGLDPGETFKVVDGEVLSRTPMKRTDAGGHHYARYLVEAQITKPFDTTRFPRDTHQLRIAIEDRSLQSYQLQFVTSPKDSSVSSRVKVQGYAITSTNAVVKPHGYKTSMGDPDLPDDYRATFSQFVYAMDIERASWGLFAKMFLPLYIAVLLGWASLFLNSPGERLAMGGTALFVAIMNGEVTATLVPNTGISTLGDVIEKLGYMWIGVMVVQAVIYHRCWSPDERTPLVRVFDTVTIVLAGVLYAWLNVSVLVAAT